LTPALVVRHCVAVVPLDGCLEVVVMKRVFIVVLATLALTVTGCGDSGGSGSADPTVFDPASLQDLDPTDEAAVTVACEGMSVGCGYLSGTEAYCGNCSVASPVCWDGQCVGDDICAHESVSDIAPPANFYPMAEAAYTKLSGGKFKLFYVATQGGAEPPFTKVTLELDHESLANKGVGTFQLSAADGDLGCDLCVRGFGYCNSDGCALHFLPESGQLEITHSGEAGTPFRATLKNVVFKQYNVEGGKYLPYPKGFQWCLGTYEIDVDVPPLSQAEDFCVEPGTGMGFGDNIADYTLTNCLGDEVSLHSRCGYTDAVWMVATAGWCGACEAFVPKVGDYFTQATNEGKNLDIMILYAETKSSVKPTLDDCLAYANDKGIDPAQVFVDNEDSRSWANTFDHINNYSSGSFGIPWSVVLDGRSMEYMWSSTLGTGSVYEAVENLIGPPLN
jgi:hypothetical protein